MQGKQQVMRDRAIRKAEKISQDPVEMARMALEQDGDHVAADDKRLMETIEHDTAALDSPETFVSRYAHPLSPEGKARNATVSLFISANGWLGKALQAAERDNVLYDEAIKVIETFDETMFLVSAWLEGSLPEFKDWSDVASCLLLSIAKSPQFWKKEFGPFEPLPIIPEAPKEKVNKEEEELMDGMDRIWKEVKAGPRKMRKSKGTKARGDLGFADDVNGDVDTSPVQKRPGEEDEFLRTWRSYLQAHLWDKKIRPKDPYSSGK